MVARGISLTKKMIIHEFKILIIFVIDTLCGGQKKKLTSLHILKKEKKNQITLLHTIIVGHQDKLGNWQTK